MEIRNRGFNPYPYQPLMRFFYEGGSPPPGTSQAVDHLQSVWSFATWLQSYFPDIYSVVTQSRPDLLDPGAVVSSGALAPVGAASGLAGLGETQDSTLPISEWGKNLLDLAKTYLQVDTQRDLLAANIRLSERGLPPINAGQIAPQVNVGLSADMQKLAMVAVGGLVLAGLVAAVRKR